MDRDKKRELLERDLDAAMNWLPGPERERRIAELQAAIDRHDGKIEVDPIPIDDDYFPRG